MAKISRETVLEATIIGLNKAQNAYLEWTNNSEGVSNGAEYVLTTYIAETIGSEEDIGSIYVEKSISALYDSAKKTPNEICILDGRNNGRADIVLSLKNEQPLAIIEVKNNVNRNKKVAADIKRIRCLLQDEIIEYGIIAFITEYEEKNIDLSEVEKRTKKLIKLCRGDANDLQYKYRTEIFNPEESYGENLWAWSSVAILFSRK